MDMYDCIYGAEKRIYNAGMYMETGSGVNRVCDEIHSSIMFAMWAWLYGKGYEPDTGGWSFIQAQFSRLAPDEIRKPAIYCASHATMLQFDQEGGFNYEEEPMPYEQWKGFVVELIGRAEDCIIAIEEDIGCAEKELKKLWLHRRKTED